MSLLAEPKDETRKLLEFYQSSFFLPCHALPTPMNVFTVNIGTVSKENN